MTIPIAASEFLGEALLSLPMKGKTMKKIKENNMKAVFIPKLNKNDESLFVAVNGKRILVKKGETVMLPCAFAEVVENSASMARQAEKFIEAVCSEG